MINVEKIFLVITEFLSPLRGANWKVIFLCVSTAAIFWFFNALNKVYTTRISYPVTLKYNKDSLVALKDPPDEIPINVTGGGWQLLKKTVSVNVVPVVIEPENPVQTQFFTANNLLPIFSKQLKDININYIATDTIFFKIEPYKDRKLFIKLDSQGIQLRKDHYIISQVFLQPDSVVFHGPISFIDQLPETFMVSLSDKNIDNDYDEELSLDLFSSSLIKKNPEVIHIVFDVEEFIEQKSMLNVELVNFPYDSTIYIQNNIVEVSYKVRRSFRNKSKPDDFLIIADLNNVYAADSTITIEAMDLPSYLMDMTFHENRVKVIYAQ